MNEIALKTTPASQARLILHTAASAPAVITSSTGGRRTRGAASKNAQRAVYAYLQAIRSLNRDRVTPEEVARALGISTASALAASIAMRSKGVKRSR